ncbi:hypothetical protein FRC10_001317, partial [Ceratobasidium sp. 414]
LPEGLCTLWGPPTYDAAAQQLSYHSCNCDRSPAVKKLVLGALQMRKGFHFENLGNFHDNMTHEATVDKVEQTIVFVNDYRAAHPVAAAVRKHYGLSGNLARNLVPVYHSLKGDRSKKRIERQFQAQKARVLHTFTPLTIVQGINFPRVKMIINYLVPRSQETWRQRAGRAGREKGTRQAGIDVSAELLNIKVEDDDDSEDENLPAVVPKGSKKAASKMAKGLYTMLIRIVEYLVTKGCLVEVLDREFENQPHVPCYQIEG